MHVNVHRPVRRGAVGKGPRRRDLARGLPYSLFGYAQGELIGHPVLDLVAPAYREPMTAFFLVTGWGPAIDSAEARGQRRRGRPGQTVSTC
jgi:hypothetical protein